MDHSTYEDMMDFPEATKLAELVTLNEQIADAVFDDGVQFVPNIEIKGKLIDVYYYAKKWNEIWGKHDFFDRVLNCNDLDNALENAKKLLEGKFKVERVEVQQPSIYQVKAVEVSDGTP